MYVFSDISEMMAIANLWEDLCIYFKELAGGSGAGNGSESELANPSHTWEDWIFAESRRR